MEPAGDPGITPPRFRRYFFRGAALLAAAPVLLFLLSNLWLATPWGRGWVAGKISSRIGLEARLDGATWAPWSGIRLRGLTLSQPAPLRAIVREPLFTADSIRVWPVWKSWLKRRAEITSIEIETPRVVVPLQLLSHLAPVQPTPPALPAVAAVETPATPPATAPPTLTPSTGSAPPTASGVPIIPQPETPPVDAVPEMPPAPAPAPMPPPTGPPGPTGWVHVRSGSFAVVSAGNDAALFEARGFHTDLPLGGDPASSFARLDSLDLLGNRVLAGLQIPLQWQAPVLTIGPGEQQPAGVTVRGVAKIGLLPGLPAQIEMECPLQKDLAWDWPRKTGAKLGEFRGAARFNGLLTTPASWQGDLVAESHTITARLPDHTQTFERAGMVTTLRGGILSCRDARFIGDTLSLLGNTTLISDGRGAAVLRIVADPALAGSIIARFAAVGAPLAFAPLGTPDRLAVDFTLYTYPDGSTALQLGNGGIWLDTQNTGLLIKALAGASP